MQRNGFPVSPLVLAVILGGMMDPNPSRTLVMGLGSPAIILDRPNASVILAPAALAEFVSGIGCNPRATTRHRAPVMACDMPS